MPRKQPEKITLPLRDLRELFTAPDFDPADVRTTVDRSTTDAFEDELYESGIDYLMSRLRGQRLPRHGQLMLALPSGTVQPDLAGTARRAIDRYCRHKILETKRTLNELLWTGLKALQVGVLFLASCLVLAAAIARSNVAPGSFGDVLTQGLTIVGWVSLWRPVEVFLYEWWPLWRDVRVYDYILRMDIAIQPRSPPTDRIRDTAGRTFSGWHCHGGQRADTINSGKFGMQPEAGDGIHDLMRTKHGDSLVHQNLRDS